jgi:hypothetical protein
VPLMAPLDSRCDDDVSIHMQTYYMHSSTCILESIHVYHNKHLLRRTGMEAGLDSHLQVGSQLRRGARLSWLQAKILKKYFLY